MSLKKFFLASLVSVAALSSVANAEGYYVQANGGVSISTDASKDVKKKMGNSAIYGLEFGAKVSDSFRAGLSLDYRPNYSAKRTDAYQISEGKRMPFHDNMENAYNYKVKSLVAMANLYYDVTDFNGIVPYVHLGLGVAQNKVKVTVDQYSVDSKADHNYSNASKTRTNFAYKLGLGARHAINEQFDIDVRYQYVDLGKFKLDNVVKGNSTGSVEGKLRSHDLLLGVAFKF